jgi:hypothetical protein
MSIQLLLLSPIRSKVQVEIILVTPYHSAFVCTCLLVGKNETKNQFNLSTKPFKPTFPVPGGPYSRTPDRLRNLEENRCLYIRGN